MIEREWYANPKPPDQDMRMLWLLAQAKSMGFQPVNYGNPIQRRQHLWTELRMFFELDRLLTMRRNIRARYSGRNL